MIYLSKMHNIVGIDIYFILKRLEEIRHTNLTGYKSFLMSVNNFKLNRC